MTHIPGHLAFVGFGEAATAFVNGWAAHRPGTLSAYDIRDDAEMQVRLADHDVTGGPIDQALAGAEVVLSLVTADQALDAARTAAPALAPGALWLDCNSCAPGTKRQAAAAIEGAGARYVDVAVMAPVHPRRHHVPLLVSGPHAEAAAEVLRALDMRPEVSGDAVGQASAVKMIRSVMIKGLEALTAECFLSARRAGVEDRVLASLEASDPEMNWRERGAYNLERMMVHGPRRAAEMREVTTTVAELGLGGGISAAAADWQARIGALEADPGEDDLLARLDTVLRQL
ncbi:DUF1932 domain-containing protein [Palleronia sp.]|uniref:NAD(P)-dependent oxidoreductase n=1 Tax=Palleronia sp. TaxID=1940284 RepID=UPI0035C83912